jgi:hypothetical protein
MTWTPKKDINETKICTAEEQGGTDEAPTLIIEPSPFRFIKSAHVRNINLTIYTTKCVL